MVLDTKEMERVHGPVNCRQTFHKHCILKDDFSLCLEIADLMVVAQFQTMSVLCFHLWGGSLGGDLANSSASELRKGPGCTVRLKSTEL